MGQFQPPGPSFPHGYILRHSFPGHHQNGCWGHWSTVNLCPVNLYLTICTLEDLYWISSCLAKPFRIHSYLMSFQLKNKEGREQNTDCISCSLKATLQRNLTCPGCHIFPSACEVVFSHLCTSFFGAATSEQSYGTENKSAQVPPTSAGQRSVFTCLGRHSSCCSVMSFGSPQGHCWPLWLPAVCTHWHSTCQ